MPRRASGIGATKTGPRTSVMMMTGVLYAHLAIHVKCQQLSRAAVCSVMMSVTSRLLPQLVSSSQVRLALVVQLLEVFFCFFVACYHCTACLLGMLCFRHDTIEWQGLHIWTLLGMAMQIS